MHHNHVEREPRNGSQSLSNVRQPFDRRPPNDDRLAAHPPPYENVGSILSKLKFLIDSVRTEGLGGLKKIWQQMSIGLALQLILLEFAISIDPIFAKPAQPLLCFG
jgi:hypothetical protein